MNSIILIGNLTRDPEVNVTPNGVNVCKFDMAVNRIVKAGEEGAVDFFHIVAWRGLGDLCFKYLHKGHKVAVYGNIQTRSYDAKDGTKRYVTEIIAEKVEFLSQKRNEEAPSAAAGTPTAATDDSLPF